MKTIAIVGILMIAVFGFEGSARAFEGGTKAIVAMTNPEMGGAQYGPLVVVAHHELAPSKPVTGLLRRVPEPTLSIERIREEKPGRSTGTKAIVLFQKEG